MYPNLNAELARKGWSKKDLASHLGMRYATLIDKLNGKYPLTYVECLNIKNAVNPQSTVEFIFFTR